MQKKAFVSAYTSIILAFNPAAFIVEFVLSGVLTTDQVFIRRKVSKSMPEVDQLSAVGLKLAGLLADVAGLSDQIADVNKTLAIMNTGQARILEQLEMFNRNLKKLDPIRRPGR